MTPTTFPFTLQLLWSLFFPRWVYIRDIPTPQGVRDAGRLEGPDGTCFQVQCPAHSSQIQLTRLTPPDPTGHKPQEDPRPTVRLSLRWTLAHLRHVLMPFLHHHQGQPTPALLAESLPPHEVPS